ncbi:hypothetical protein [Aquitalea palustris]|nr:hypothetical protein [Aquitalea palustris]
MSFRNFGQDHWKAKLTDHEVELMRLLHERDGIGYRRLATMFDVSRDYVVRICKYRTR